MKRLTYCLFVLLFIALNSCNTPTSKEENTTEEVSKTVEKETTEPSILSSFVFVGCNRVDRHDKDKTEATNASTANLSALKRIYDDITTLEHQPELFFFLGDMVLAESTLDNLNVQLAAWVELYKNPEFSKISESGIELVAVPGNHEMLTYTDHGIPHHDEWPLKGATDIWMKYMSPYIPADCEHINGPDSLENRATFSFVRNNVGFVVMNTDTYNSPTKTNPYGLEGVIPVDWIKRISRKSWN